MPTTRPISVTILAVVFAAAGAVGFVYHFPELMAFHGDALLIEAIRLLAVVAGVFLLRGCNWARWLALGWIWFHVVVSAFHALGELAAHCVFAVVIAWILFRPAAERYFRRAADDQ